MPECTEAERALLDHMLVDEPGPDHHILRQVLLDAVMAERLTPEKREALVLAHVGNPFAPKT